MMGLCKMREATTYIVFAAYVFGPQWTNIASDYYEVEISHLNVFS